MRTQRVFPVAVGLLMTACATVPAGPSVMVLPGNGKNFEQFQADDAVCRQWAAQQTGTTTKQAATESAVSGAAIGTVLGAAAGAAVGAAAKSPSTGAAVGAGAGLLGGAAIGGSTRRAQGPKGRTGTTRTNMSGSTARGTRIPMARASFPPPTVGHPAAPPPPHP